MQRSAQRTHFLTASIETLRTPYVAQTALGVGHVNAIDLPGRPGFQRSDEGVRSRTTAQIQHVLSRFYLCQIEVKADPCKGVERFAGYLIEVARVVAETFCQCAARLEVKLAIRIQCDPLIHVFHFLFQIDRIHRSFHRCNSHGCLLPMSRIASRDICAEPACVAKDA